MPLLNAKCTNCGADLLIDGTQEAAICQFCNSAFIVEKAVNNYHNTFEIRNSVVNIHGNIKNDFNIVGGKLLEYTGESVDVVIPENVVSIGENAFSNSLIETVTINEGVREICEAAFYNCKELYRINIPKSVKTIASKSFASCIKLKKISIPSTVRILCQLNKMDYSSGAFYNCKSLSIVEYANFVTYKESFIKTPYYSEYMRKQFENEQAHRRNEWKRNGLCDNCGGKISLISNKCKKCGKKF